MTRPYANKRKVAVSVGERYNGLYGFATNIPDGDSGQLGHQAVTANMGTPVFFGASRPQPARVRKGGVDTTTSFLSATVDLATLANWVLVERAKRGPDPKDSAKSQRLYVDIFQAKYAWNAPKWNANRLPAGLRKPVTGADYCFLGANSIEGVAEVEGGILGKPPRAVAELPGEDGVDRVSTFLSYPLPAQMPDGWSSTL